MGILRSKSRNYIFKIIMGMIFSICLLGRGESAVAATPSDAFELVEDMGAGINVGNTLDYVYYKRLSDKEYTTEYCETRWGNPTITKELIHAYKEAGFKTVRIPVSWYNHVIEDPSDTDYDPSVMNSYRWKPSEIREEWLDRVEEVVQWVLDEGMYCILDVHHDSGEGMWIRATENETRAAFYKEKLASLWSQIATRFASYDERLIFEGFNEILNQDSSWGTYSDGDLQAVNDLNQVFVNTVRSSGGKNTTRFLIVKTYGAMITERISENFTIPNDTVSGRIIGGVHNYTADKDVEKSFGLAAEMFQRLGVPGIIGECGRSGSDVSKKMSYVKSLVSAAKTYDLGYIWWDDGSSVSNSSDVKNFCLFNRKTAKCYFPSIVKALVLGDENDEVSTTEVEETTIAEESSSEETTATEESSSEETTATEESSSEESSEAERSVKVLDSIKYTYGSTSVDTGIKFDKNTVIEEKFTYEYTAYRDLVSAYNGSSRVLALRFELNTLMEGYGWYNEKMAVMTQGTTYTLRQDNNKAYLNGKLVKTASQQTISSAPITFNVFETFHYLKIWKSGKLVAWYVPVYDKDGNLAIYDKISKNSVTALGKCTAGSIIGGEESSEETSEAEESSSEESTAEETSKAEESSSEESTAEETSKAEESSSEESTAEETSKAEESSSEESSSEERGVKVLDSIKYTYGCTSVNTGIKFDKDAVIEEKFTYEYTAYRDLVSAYNGSNRVLALRFESDTLMEGYGWYNEKMAVMTKGTTYTVKQDNNKVYLNGKLVRMASQQTLPSAPITFNVFETFHYLKIWKGGELVAWYVPVYDENGNLAIYDKISKNSVAALGKCTAGNIIGSEASSEETSEAEESSSEESTAEETSKAEESSSEESTAEETSKIEESSSEESTAEETSQAEESSSEESTAEETSKIEESSSEESTAEETSKIEESSSEESTAEETSKIEESSSEESTAEETSKAEESSSEESTAEETSETEESSSEESTSEPNIEIIGSVRYVKDVTSVDTGIMFDENTMIEAQFTYEYATYRDLVAAYNGVYNSSNRVLALRFESDTLMEGYGWYNEKIAVMTKGTTYTVTQKNNEVYLNGELMRTASQQTLPSAPITFNVFETFHYLKIWKNGELVAYYVPARKGGVTVLLDQVTKKEIALTGTYN